MCCFSQFNAHINVLCKFVLSVNEIHVGYIYGDNTMSFSKFISGLQSVISQKCSVHNTTNRICFDLPNLDLLEIHIKLHEANAKFLNTNTQATMECLREKSAAFIMVKEGTF